MSMDDDQTGEATESQGSAPASESGPPQNALPKSAPSQNAPSQNAISQTGPPPTAPATAGPLPTGPPQTASPRLQPPHRTGRWSRLCLKELRETLRDRRTLITLVLMPLLVYPILSIVFQRSIVSAWKAETSQIMLSVGDEELLNRLQIMLVAAERYRQSQRPRDDRPVQADKPVAVSGDGMMAPFASAEIAPDDIVFKIVDDPIEAVRMELVDAGVVRSEATDTLKLVYRGQSSMSLKALEYLEDRVRQLNEVSLRQRLQRARLPDDLVVRTERVLIKTDASGNAMATLVPLILILMTVTGAVYPAIDLTAGERERGTLEMLMVSPVPRLRLLLAKYFAVITVAVLTSLVNLVAMSVTLWATGLNRLLFDETGFGWTQIAQTLLLLTLFAAFFSAVLLAITSFARSFKEAQAYLIPLMLLSLGPGMISLLPGLELNGWLSVAPIANMVLLARDLFAGSVAFWPAVFCVGSTGVYTIIAISMAARVFGADAVGSGSQAGWGDWWRRDAEFQQARAIPTVPSAVLCLAVIFPAYFFVANGLGRAESLPLTVRLLVAGVGTSILFGLFPAVACWLQQVSWRQTLRLRGTQSVPLGVALLLGPTLWPLAHELVLFTQWINLATIRPEQLAGVEDLLTQWRTISPIWIVLAMAAAPALFEELFFRGYLFSAISASSSRVATVLLTALVFGMFHVVSSSALSFERFLPSTFLGLVLGLMSLRTHSIWPGVLLHFLHNACLLMLAYYRDELSRAGWGVEEQQHLPTVWIAGSLFSLLLGTFAISVWRPTTESAEALPTRPTD